MRDERVRLDLRDGDGEVRHHAQDDVDRVESAATCESQIQMPSGGVPQKENIGARLTASHHAIHNDHDALVAVRVVGRSERVQRRP